LFGILRQILAKVHLRPRPFFIQLIQSSSRLIKRIQINVIGFFGLRQNCRELAPVVPKSGNLAGGNEIGRDTSTINTDSL